MSQATGARILVVDDEPAIVRTVELNLRRHQFQVDSARTGQAALEAYTRRRPDLVLLDLGLPDLDGLDVIRSIRAHASTPIIVLSVRGAERDKVEALDLGADDYLTKPFGPSELLARIRVALRHAAGPAHGTESVMRVGDLAVDLEHRRVTLAGREVHLTPTEYELLRVLVTNPDRVLTHRFLLRTALGAGYEDALDNLRTFIAQVRRKLEREPSRPHWILTEPAVGYRFRPDA
jgi:two-component system KDP operon response regulator KdpE